MRLTSFFTIDNHKRLEQDLRRRVVNNKREPDSEEFKCHTVNGVLLGDLVPPPLSVTERKDTTTCPDSGLRIRSTNKS